MKRELPLSCYGRLRRTHPSEREAEGRASNPVGEGLAPPANAECGIAGVVGGGRLASAAGVVLYLIHRCGSPPSPRGRQGEVPYGNCVFLFNLSNRRGVDTLPPSPNLQHIADGKALAEGRGRDDARARGQTEFREAAAPGKGAVLNEGQVCGQTQGAE